MLHHNKPVALVTGGAKRIGAAIVNDLAANGFAVAIHANTSLDNAGRMAAHIRSEGGAAAAVAGDLADAAASASIIDRAADTLGPVQLLVNCASVFKPDFAQTPDMALFDAHFAVHVKSPSVMSARMVERLPKGMPGLIVNVIDQRVWRLTPHFYTYTLSKAALWTATQTMAMAFAPHVRVNAIGPGPTLANERQDPKDFQAQVDAVPLRHAPSLDEFGATVRYLWAAKSITGQMIALDSGQHLAWETPDVLNANE
ncbi:MAG: SDR family oxidoreductase [Rhizobiaceae bacterium]|jgi:NAD(P)-dependent dehydrogenase (short-subunit alcohol dehydrogenase family)|nr:SDR family oxidoreductase [Rhizobiaceae bacterium]